MKRFWSQVSIKDLIFGIIIFVIVILITVVRSADKVTITFGDDAVDVKTSKYTMNIPYDMIERTELVDMPDRGEVIDGADDMSSRTGLWKNDTWGEYYVCSDLNVTTCIVAYLDNDSIFVFNRKDEEETRIVYDTLISYLP